MQKADFSSQLKYGRMGSPYLDLVHQTGLVTHGKGQ